MGTATAHFLRVLVSEEIERRLAGSAESHHVIPVAAWSREIAAKYRRSDFSEHEIADQIVSEAARLGVPAQSVTGNSQSSDYLGPSFARP
jgi:hypothetical protein